MVSLKTHSDISGSPWEFPKDLLGTKIEVDKAWGRLARAAVSAKSWSNILPTVEYLSISDSAMPIQLDQLSWHYPARQSLWRLYSIPVITSALCRDVEHGGDLYMDLMLEVAEHFWGALPLLDNASFQSCHHHAGEFYVHTDTEWIQSVFRAIIRWLPEMELLKPRIANGYSPELRSRMEGDGWVKGAWADGLISICYELGVPIATVQKAAMDDSLINMMLGEGLIRRDSDGRYNVA